MLKSTKLKLRLSEIRERLNTLNVKETEAALTAEERTERSTLEAESTALEPEYRTAVESEEAAARGRAAASGEESERRQLRDKVTFRDYFTAAAEMRMANGAAGEFNQSLNMKTGAFPLDILAPPEVRRMTDADAGPRRPATWTDLVFAETMAMRLGITFPSVEPGEQSYPVVTAAATAAQRGRGEAIADSAWMVGVTEAKPTRNGVSATYSREDDYRSPGLADAIQRMLYGSLMEGVDRLIFLGDSGASENAADIAGLTTHGDVSEVTLTQAAKATASGWATLFSDLIDGVYCGGFADQNIVLAVGAARLLEGSIANAAAENETLAAFLRQLGLSWGVRGEVETATTAGKFGGFIGLARGIEGAGVAPQWRSADLVIDPFSESRSGEVIVSLSAYHNFVLPRAANFRRLKFVA